MPDPCIYCQKPNTQPSAEHVVADALGGCIELKPGDVCKPCNNRIDQQIDRNVQNDLRPILAQLEITGKRGETTKWVAEETVGGAPRRFRIGADEIVAAEARVLLAKDGASYSFRATSLAELERARDEVAAKRIGETVFLEDVEERTPELPEGRRDEIDFRAPYWQRWAAKTCMNAICYVGGPDLALAPGLDDLRRFAIDGGTTPPQLRVGGIGDGDAEIDNRLRLHAIEVRVIANMLSVRVSLFGFAGCTFTCAVKSRDVHRMMVLDAVTRKVVADQCV